MSQSLYLSLSALVVLAAPALYCLKGPNEKGLLFWALMGAALFGALSLVGVLYEGSLGISLSLAIWATISATLIGFLIFCFMTDLAWRLSVLLMPYLVFLGLWGLVWQAVPGHDTQGGETLTNWILFHVIFSIFTYGFATLAAIAALSSFLVERALKNKRPTALSRFLPSVVDSERLLVKLLLTSEAILALGLLSGMGVSYLETGSLLVSDHKTFFSLAAFGAIAILLWAQFHHGVRGKKASRIVLVAYLFLSLGFLGVKFVTDVMIS